MTMLTFREPLRSAWISPCEQYRYTLGRVWGYGAPTGAFVGLNPSKADAKDDDHTIRRETGFARSWGWSGFIKLNLYALISTDPDALLCASRRDPIGPDNDRALFDWISKVPVVVCCWGAHRAVDDREEAVLKIIRDLRRRPMCLGTTKDGYPCHPLRLPKTRKLVEYVGRAGRTT